MGDIQKLNCIMTIALLLLGMDLGYSFGKIAGRNANTNVVRSRAKRNWKNGSVAEWQTPRT